MLVGSGVLAASGWLVLIALSSWAIVEDSVFTAAEGSAAGATTSGVASVSKWAGAPVVQGSCPYNNAVLRSMIISRPIKSTTDRTIPKMKGPLKPNLAYRAPPVAGPRRSLKARISGGRDWATTQTRQSYPSWRFPAVLLHNFNSHHRSRLV